MTLPDDDWIEMAAAKAAGEGAESIAYKLLRTYEALRHTLPPEQAEELIAQIKSLWQDLPASN